MNHRAKSWRIVLKTYPNNLCLDKEVNSVMQTAAFNSNYHTLIYLWYGILQNILSPSSKLGMIQVTANRQLLLSLK